MSANKIGVKVGDRTIPWREITTRQMLHFVRQYLDDPQVTKTIRLRELAGLNVSAALFCHVNGGPEAARHYAGKAVRLLPTAQEDVDRLLPELAAADDETLE